VNRLIGESEFSSVTLSMHFVVPPSCLRSLDRRIGLRREATLP